MKSHTKHIITNAMVGIVAVLAVGFVAGVITPAFALAGGVGALLTSGGFEGVNRYINGKDVRYNYIAHVGLSTAAALGGMICVVITTGL